MPLAADSPTLTPPYSTFTMETQENPYYYYPKRTKDRRGNSRSTSPHLAYADDRKSGSDGRDDRTTFDPTQRSFPDGAGAKKAGTIGQPDSRQKPDFGDGNYAAIVLGSLLLVAIAAAITLALRYKYRKRNVRSTCLIRASQNGRSSGHLREYELPFVTPLNSDNARFISRAGNGNYNTSPYDTARNPSLKLYDEIPYIRAGELIGSGDSAYLHYREPEEPPELPPRPLTLGCESDEKSPEIMEDGNGQKANGDTSIFSASTDSGILMGKDERNIGEVSAVSEAFDENDGLNNIPIVENTNDKESRESGQSRHTEVTVLSSVTIPLTVEFADADDR